MLEFREFHYRSETYERPVYSVHAIRENYKGFWFIWNKHKFYLYLSYGKSMNVIC